MKKGRQGSEEGKWEAGKSKGSGVKETRQKGVNRRRKRKNGRQGKGNVMENEMERTGEAGEIEQRGKYM